jgi:hypothetical protein
MGNTSYMSLHATSFWYCMLTVSTNFSVDSLFDGRCVHFFLSCERESILAEMTIKVHVDKDECLFRV